METFNTLNPNANLPSDSEIPALESGINSFRDGNLNYNKVEAYTSTGVRITNPEMKTDT